MSFANFGRQDGPVDASMETRAAFGTGPLPVDLSFELANGDILREMAADWASGRCTPAERWFERYPHLAGQPETAVQIVYEEVCLREEQGEVVDAEAICRRFPQWQDALEKLFECHQLIRPEHPAPTFPEEGQQLGELQMVARLGRGAAGQVFLARQPSLSDRPLVVKLTPRTGDEHLSLARLQHTHIVPLYHVQDFPAQRLRALCMPYLGGMSWSALLAALRRQPTRPRTGRSIVDALAAAAAGLPVAPTRSGPALGFLSRSSYVQSVCWIGGCLADALHYAHQCGLVHLDVKASNVLIAGDGQPMLLDFHLARPVIPANSPPPDRLGGTRGYMSPEQELATTAVREGHRVPVALDERSDIYSLGVTLYESLTGRLPTADLAASRRYFRQTSSAESRGLEDIIHKCLASNPGERYADAGQLAADLRRHLADLPLHGVPNRSLAERWRKWRRRKPHALAGASALIVIVGVIGIFAAAFYRDRLEAARTALSQAETNIASRDFNAAVDRLEAGRSAAHWLPGQGGLKQAIETQLAAARQGRVARAVHDLVEQLRFLDGVGSVSPVQWRHLDAACDTLWRAREKLLPPETAGDHSTERAALCSDLTDLVAAWAGLRIAQAAGDQSATAQAEARRQLDEAQALCGRSFTIDLARHEYFPDASAGREAASFPQPQTARDHYALGRFLLRADKLDEAREQFERAMALEPGTFWPYFYLSLCAHKQHDFERALRAADVCVALMPNSAPCFYNRALCYESLDRADEALADLNRAVALDPSLAVGWLRRGVLQAARRHFAEATTSFTTALERGANPADVYYQLALVDVAERNRDAALAHLRLALQHDAGNAPAVALKAQLESAP